MVEGSGAPTENVVLLTNRGSVFGVARMLPSGSVRMASTKLRLAVPCRWRRRTLGTQRLPRPHHFATSEIEAVYYVERARRAVRIRAIGPGVVVQRVGRRHMGTEQKLAESPDVQGGENPAQLLDL